MAEVKNAFIKSKMNKDLDDRLIPSGEYRNAINTQVSKSEAADVGALENALGNSLKQEFESGISDLSSIGYLVDESRNDIYVFLTDNITGSYTPRGIDVDPAEGSNHFIYKYNTLTGAKTKLVEGPFLNFSKLNPIYGVNLLEESLFWTDNRNQPRKINVISAESNGYYSTEDDISVARYNPYRAIELFKESSLSPNNYETTMKDVISIAYPNGGTSSTVGGQYGTNITIQDTDIPIGGVPVPGQSVKYVDPSGEVQDFPTAVTVAATPVSTSTDLYVSGPISVTNALVLVFNANPYYIPKYAGDPKFLQDKFIRFSYRFKFDNGEYSIMAPFTQPCFIPKQDGYFLNNSSTDGDQQQAFASTIVDFMENKVNKINLQIPLPSAVNELVADFHVSEIDILYKESDGLTVKVVDTIIASTLDSSDASSVLEFEYESQIPYKTLPSDEITRVYDKVPVKALAQEIISNRVVYGNYQDKHTPPASLNYNVSVSAKEDFNLQAGTADVNGAVVDSASITIDNTSGTVIAGSIVTGTGILAETIVVSTDNVNMVLSQIATLADNTILSFSLDSNVSSFTSDVEYPSSSLKTNRNYQVGFVLSDRFGRQSTVILSNNENAALVNSQTFRGSTVYSPYVNNEITITEWIGNSLKISVNDQIGTIEPDPSTNSPGIYNGDVSSLDYNPLGWYSYKIVVKQVEQEYYNIYTSGAMKGLPYNYSTSDLLPIKNENTSFITLLNDNINKIPRDLSLVGPQDKTFRSSVVLFGRVDNISNDLNIGNEQFYPGKKSFTTTSIENLSDLFDVKAFKGDFLEPIPVTNVLNAFHGFYKSDSNPFIAEINTFQTSGLQFGVNNSTTTTLGEASNISTTVPNAITIDVNVTSGSIEVGSIITHVNNIPEPSSTNYAVVDTTGGATPTLTLNKNISLAANDTLAFSSQTFNNINSLAIFETAPVVSKLDIFWETSSSGLITDLNNLVANDTGAGVGFDSWNDAAFNEGIPVSSAILSANFNLVDNFGQNIVFGAGDSLEIVSVYNQTAGTSLDFSSYFELYEPLGAGNGFNIKTINPPPPAAIYGFYYGDVPGSNDFDFQFMSSINGSSTNYSQVANLANENPVMYGPSPSTGIAIDDNLYVSTFNSELGTFTAVNGANPATLNQGKDITWAVTATDSLSNDISPSFGVSYSNTSELSTCVLSNTSVLTAGSSPYTIKLRCIDAGSAFEEITINALIGVVPVSVTDVYQNFLYSYGGASWSIPQYAVVIEIANSPDPNYVKDGWYLLNSTWANNSAGWTIDLKEIIQCMVPAIPWYFSAVSQNAVISLWANCVRGSGNATGTPTKTPISSLDYLSHSFQLIV